MRPIFTVAAIGVLLFVGASQTRAQSDPRVGTWQLDASKSKSENPTYARKSEIRTYESSGSTIKASAEFVSNDGKKATYGFNSTPDGKEYPYTGQRPGGAETLSTKRTGNTFSSVSKKGGKVLYTTTNVVSKDGKTLTLTTKGSDENGQNIGSVRVYTRQ